MNQLTARAIKGRPKRMHTDAIEMLTSRCMVEWSASIKINVATKKSKFRYFCEKLSEPVLGNEFHFKVVKKIRVNLTSDMLNVLRYFFKNQPHATPTAYGRILVHGEMYSSVPVNSNTSKLGKNLY
jgi:hypothetical protein